MLNRGELLVRGHSRVTVPQAQRPERKGDRRSARVCNL